MASAGSVLPAARRSVTSEYGGAAHCTSPSAPKGKAPGAPQPSSASATPAAHKAPMPRPGMCVAAPSPYTKTAQYPLKSATCRARPPARLDQRDPVLPAQPAAQPPNLRSAAPCLRTSASLGRPSGAGLTADPARRQTRARPPSHAGQLGSSVVVQLGLRRSQPPLWGGRRVAAMLFFSLFKTMVGKEVRHGGRRRAGRDRPGAVHLAATRPTGRGGRRRACNCCRHVLCGVHGGPRR